MSILFQNNFQRGFGTFPLHGEEAIAAVGEAIEVGYRAFDTAQMYGNEADVGQALANCGVDRKELCITTKVPTQRFNASDFIPSVERSLKDLQVDYVDLLLLHWPPADGNIAPSLKLLAEAHSKGFARNIGVSNYTSKMMREAAATVDVPLATNQVEFHPLLNQEILLAAAAETGITLSAYCSVARGKVFDYQDFAEIGQHYGKSAAQVVLRWIVQLGVAAITMSTKRDNMLANYEIMDFTLSSVHMARINSLTAAGYRIVDNNIVPGAPDWD